jgi:biotin carboxyl carrier protein
MPWTVRILLMSLVPLLAGAAVGGVCWYEYRERPRSTDERPAPVVERTAGALRFAPALAESYGIRAAPVSEIAWRQQPTVFGRVVPNPQAAAEVRAPFAGVLKPVPGQPWPKLGDHVVGRHVLALMETRLSPAERIDVHAKSVDADVKYRGAEKAVEIQELRLRRLQELDAQGAAAKRDLETAQLAVLEARTLRDAAQAQAKIYEQALAAPEGKTTLVPLIAPLTGDVAELFAQPGLIVEPGYVLLKVIDFRRLLVRLEFPVALARGAIPHDVAVTLATADVHESPVPAQYTGSAPQVEAASQRVALLYALDAPPGMAAWRPGLYVRASFADPSVAPRPAVAVPALPSGARPRLCPAEP